MNRLQKFWWCVRYVAYFMWVTRDLSHPQTLWEWAESWHDHVDEHWRIDPLTPQDAVYEDMSNA